MKVKAIYEDGVLKRRGPLPFKEHEEVEIDFRPGGEVAFEDEDQDPRTFVGMLKTAPNRVPIARDHDDDLDK
jgi:predicted DNA-binding antitoxin AbrB/MazE fold protein